MREWLVTVWSVVSLTAAIPSSVSAADAVRLPLTSGWAIQSSVGVGWSTLKSTRARRRYGRSLHFPGIPGAAAAGRIAVAIPRRALRGPSRKSVGVSPAG